MNFFKNVFVSILFAVIVYLTIFLKAEGTLGLYSIFLVFYLVIKMGLSFAYKPFKGTAKNYHVAVVIPSYNENADGLIDTVESILNQDYPVKEIYIVDDGSSDTSSFDQLEQYVMNNAERCQSVILRRQKENKGKRHAQAWAFEQSKADIFVTVDSDSYLYPDAIRQLLIPFNDDNIYAVTGHINARNRDDNLLTQLIDIRYDNAFRLERAAQSVTGNILVCSGPMSAYRREVIVPNLERYLNQTFLGVKVNIGDDRCLTNYAIELGRTVYQSTALCKTDVPTSLKIFIKQQIRWNKSFFRETLQALKLSLKKPLVGVWSFFEVFLWGLLLLSQFNFIIGNSTHLKLIHIGYAFLAIITSALLRNIHYASKYPLLFFLSPLYGLLHILLLQPIRLYSLLTMKNVKWGTRTVKNI